MIVKVHISFCIALLYQLFVVKKKIYWITYLFIVMHELAHMITALLFKVDIAELHLLPLGVTAKYVGDIKGKKEFWIAMSGPFASLLFAWWYHNPLYWYINIFIALFNCIPIEPLDGGRMVKVLFTCIKGESKGKKLYYHWNDCMFFVLGSIALYCQWRWHHSLFLLLVSRK